MGLIQEALGICSPRAASALLLILVVFYCIRLRYGSGLNRYPGPFLATLTNLWRMNLVSEGRAYRRHLELHRKYGEVVRLGPNVLSFSSPDAVYDIYSGKKGFRKSEFYSVQRGIRAGRSFSTIFSTTNEELHAKLRRGASNAYALTTLLQFEPLVDSTTLVLLEQIRNRWADKQGDEGICDFSTWLQYYAFDVIGELTYSKRLGFLENGRDIGEIIDSIDRGINYAGVIGQVPFFDYFLRRNPIKLLAGRLGFFNVTLKHVAFGLQRIQERKALLGSDISKSVESGKTRDFLSRFLEAYYVTRSISEDQILSLTQANINAGSDTTAISLRSIFYYALTTPGCYLKLEAEIVGAERNGLFGDTVNGLVAWTEAQKLPYLEATVKEALRIFPAVGLSMERVVPTSGAEISGKFIPGGTIVGCSPWVINFDQDVFGKDADDFRPERWIEANEEQLSKMKKYFLTFGMGSHTCIGKNISYLEMYKVVGAIIRNFQIELDDPETPWNLHGSWFVKQSGFRVRFMSRKPLPHKETTDSIL